MKKIFFIALPLLVLAGCGKTTLQQVSLGTDFLNQIPTCTQDYSGTVIDIDSVASNCTTKEKFGRLPDGLGGVYPYYRVHNGKIGEGGIFCVASDSSDEEFSGQFADYSADFVPRDSQKYLCKNT